MRPLRIDNINTPGHANEIYALKSLDEPSEVEAAKRTQMVAGITDGMKVVELGCGISSFPLLLAKMYPECEVHALDFADEVIERLKEEYPEVKYQAGNALRTPYQDHYFDYVVAGELIEHITKPMELVKEMVRICKVGGVVSVSTPFKETIWRPNDVPEEHMWEFSKDDMDGLFSPYGEVTTKFFVERPPGVGGIHMVTNCKLCPK
jgi:ubiquinone/menaquinone biosynthesis C-methylase UbiE